MTVTKMSQVKKRNKPAFDIDISESNRQYAVRYKRAVKLNRDTSTECRSDGFERAVYLCKIYRKKCSIAQYNIL